MRFLHIADVHLDAPLRGLPREARDRLRAGGRDALARAVDFVLDGGLHALLVAGDLFDGERLSFETERFLVDQLARLDGAGIPVFYATGNHDPGEGSAGGNRISWPGNVVRFADGLPARVPVRDGEGRLLGWVTGAGHATGRVTDDLAAAFPRPPGDLPEVALLHTQVHTSRGSDAHEAYAPSELSFLRSAGYDYWALGHVHARQGLSGDPPVHYPGSLLARDATETGPRGGLVVDLSSRASPRISFRPLARVRRERLDVRDIGSCRDLAALSAAVRSAWDLERSTDPGAPGTEWLVQLRLGGPSPLWAPLARADERASLEELLVRELGVLHVHVLADRVHRPVSPDEHRGRVDVLGTALRLLAEVREGRLDPGLLAPGVLASFDPDFGGSPAEYVRELLRDADVEIVARMTRPREG